ncbi:hypothetical protein CEXT_644101 [Caerostris extrusa]|uniref:Uncharacterized protein n=1 Tax=Caerostris extrusa TaxID=172846 RepID=A0AAV4TZT9_CAEEX|nr:hypothetical protein CEXT_644101 [Caerostris extrusa]
MMPRLPAGTVVEKKGHVASWRDCKDFDRKESKKLLQLPKQARNYFTNSKIKSHASFAHLFQEDSDTSTSQNPYSKPTHRKILP